MLGLSAKLVINREPQFLDVETLRKASKKNKRKGVIVSTSSSESSDEAHPTNTVNKVLAAENYVVSIFHKCYLVMFSNFFH